MIGSGEKLALFRAALIQNSIDVYIIPLSDQHLGDNVTDHWKIIPWLTGFTGSAATIVITDSFAGLWTDSRYFIQADTELEGSGFSLVKPGSLIPSDYIDWLSDNIKSRSRIGFDGRTMSVASLRKLKLKLIDKNIFFDSDCDITGGIWSDRPPLPVSEAWDFPLRFAGKERAVKIAEVREKMKKRAVDTHLLTSVDDIMWILNIRGNDVPYSPLCVSFALISETQFHFFVDEKKIPEQLISEFKKLGIKIMPYEEIPVILSSLDRDASILITPSTTSVTLYNSIPAGIIKVEDVSIPTLLKAKKNRTEIENISRAMIKDGTALTKFFYWFEKNQGSVTMTEISLAAMLSKFRAQQDEYLGPSFSAIIAFNEHAALPHYSASPETDAAIRGKGILLVDSGGQYMGGTTDITRTVSTGNPSRQQRIDFTLVLKGHIALAKAKFPFGTRGCQIDMLARKALWEEGYNYGHGTGHGVGYCLNVHEGPQSISPAENKTILEAGMLISNEPAIYREGEYGIRTENLVLCYQDEETEFGEFLKFDSVSLCYIDKSLIDISLLDKKDIEWINAYHSEVYEKLSPHLDEEEKIWLKEKTSEL